MNIAIIGSEEKKFTPATKKAALAAMAAEVSSVGGIPVIVSGRCHLGGIDVWAEEMADSLKLPKIIFPPEVHVWDGGDRVGYKQRNVQIAQTADLVVVIIPATLPPGYPPEPWNRKPCYHCAKRRQVPPVDGADGYTVRHVKSGACWTAWHAVEINGKKAKWVVI